MSLAAERDYWATLEKPQLLEIMRYLQRDLFLAHRSKTLRDEFAMAVLPAVARGGFFANAEADARSAYEYADAMLKMRGDE